MEQKKNPIIVAPQHSAKDAMQNTKSFLSITDKILKNSKIQNINPDDWMDELIKWAFENGFREPSTYELFWMSNIETKRKMLDETMREYFFRNIPEEYHNICILYINGYSIYEICLKIGITYSYTFHVYIMDYFIYERRCLDYNILPNKKNDLNNIILLKTDIKFNIEKQDLIFKLINLKTLELDCAFDKISDNISNLINLKYLTIVMPLINLPDSFCKLENLKTLNITSYIEKLPSNFSGLKNLEVLNLDLCPLKSLPNDIEKMTSLKHIFINRSKIEYLPKNIFNMPTLCSIRIVDANIKELPESTLWQQIDLDDASSIYIELDFNHNLIAKLPQSFKYLKSTLIGLCGNPLIVSYGLKDILYAMRTNECQVYVDEKIEELLNER